MSFTLFIDFSGTFVFAISGILVAIDKKFDLFGAIILGMVTAIGGGTLRDLLIGSTPVGWMTNDIYFYLIILALLVCYFFKNKIEQYRKSLFLFDTMGIGLFTILGMEKTLASGLSPLSAVMMGVVSAVFGGVIRDVLSNEIPLIFRKEIYAFACLVGALVYLFALEFCPNNIAMVLSILTVITVRVIAIKKKWELPFSPIT